MKYGDRKPVIIRRIIFVIAAVSAALLQNPASVQVGGIKVSALLLIPLTVAVSMYEREVFAALFGLFGGLILDISSGKEGFNAIVLMLTGAVCSLMISHFMRNNFITAMFLSAGSVAAYEALYISVFLIFSGAGNIFFPIMRFYLPSFLVTALFIPVFYFPVKAISAYYKEKV